MRAFLDYGYTDGRWFCFDGGSMEIRRILKWLARYDIPFDYTEDFTFIRIHRDDVAYVEELVA